jgi:16S rRNA (adenine1518-N6/adenine1519-N6)-dimethyltransferase
MDIKNDLLKGQHFLIDKKILEDEIKLSELSKDDFVIEIGAGKGVLTEELAKSSGRVLSFEIDKRYIENLEKLKSKYKNLEIIYSDASKYSWKECTKIVSNIPYFLSEKVIEKAILDGVSFLVLIVGERFKKIIENDCDKSGVLANIFYDIQFIEKIEKESFYPSPKVNSWLIKLSLKENTNSMNLIKNIIEKDGKIKNAIIYSLINNGYTKKDSKNILNEFNFNNIVLESSVRKISGKIIKKILKEF